MFEDNKGGLPNAVRTHYITSGYVSLQYLYE